MIAPVCLPKLPPATSTLGLPTFPSLCPAAALLQGGMRFLGYGVTRTAAKYSCWNICLLRVLNLLVLLWLRQPQQHQRCYMECCVHQCPSRSVEERVLSSRLKTRAKLKPQLLHENPFAHLPLQRCAENLLHLSCVPETVDSNGSPYSHSKFTTGLFVKSLAAAGSHTE